MSETRRITFYEGPSGRRPVEEYLRSLEKPERARVAERLQKVQLFGFEASRMQFRQVKGKLWELRIRTEEAHRIFYVTVSREEMVLLRAYHKKTQKAPSREIETAERRMKGCFMAGKTSAALRRRKSLDAFIAEEMRNPDFRIHFHEARAKSVIAHALVLARKRAGLTQAEVARRARTTQSVIGRLEGGTLRMPSLPLIHRVARAVGMQLTIGLVRAS